MDGNRRYAKNHSIALKEGHKHGADALVRVLDCCFRVGVKNVTTYAFSIENFSRKPEEVDTIFSLLKYKLAILSNENQMCDLHNVRVKIIGNKSYLPKDVLDDIEMVEEKTKHHNKHILFIAFPYTSRDDMWYSINKIIEKFNNGEILIDEIDEKLIENNFYYEDSSEKVDILVRTSGHTRLSDYMLWQCHQDSVIEFPNTLWPNYKFYHTWWTIFRWSYYKTLMIQDAETMQLKKVSREQVNKRYKDIPKIHPPFASVNKA
ncbi:ditrans,polycis-polyprenyl diphosphate synthase [Pichia californica]|uniref:Alkyl transferase n=1 Tax=Pichia californica TaxID=460514 RepID=A0A9P6WPA8_9ASCO|nr:ditrans,polycis-polyprenyl diphosphate synthase [[Candida] californica]KAG0690777.1 ditrans,polycis-polyprenyl diphosphate synthase [[Candida] californica]